MSIVGSDFEELKQFNLAEIYDPTPKPNVETSHITPKPDTNQSHSPSTLIDVSINPTPPPTNLTANDAAPSSVELSVQDSSPGPSIPNHHLANESQTESLMITK